MCQECAKPRNYTALRRGHSDQKRLISMDAKVRRDTRAHQYYSFSGQRCSLAVRPALVVPRVSSAGREHTRIRWHYCPLLARDRPGQGTARPSVAHRQPTPPPPRGRGAGPGRPIFGPPGRPIPPGRRSPDTRRARNWDIDIEVEVDIDDIRDINRQPRIDVHGRRWRKFAYNRSEVPVHARRARRWWWLSAADRR